MVKQTYLLNIFLKIILMITLMNIILVSFIQMELIFYEKYKWDLDDFIGPNFIIVKRSRKDIYDLLSINS